MLGREMPDLGPAVDTTLRRCLGVTAGEDVLVIVDPAKQSIGEALRAGAAKLGADAALLVMDERADHGTEPAPPVAAAMAACDVFIAPTVKSLSHTEARRRACEAGARGATMPGVTEDMLARVMAIDFDLMAARSHAVAQLLSRCSSAHVSCPNGTDLTLNLAGRDGAADDGDLTERGAFGNLPAGEGFISPVDAAGTVVPASLAGIGLASQRPTLTIEAGRLTTAVGRAGDALLDAAGAVRRAGAQRRGARDWDQRIGDADGQRARGREDSRLGARRVRRQRRYRRLGVGPDPHRRRRRRRVTDGRRSSGARRRPLRP